MPPDVRVAGGQLVGSQGQCVVWTGRLVIVEPEPGPSDVTRPGSKRRQVLPQSGWAPALMHHQVPLFLWLFLQRVQRHVRGVGYCCSQ